MTKTFLTSGAQAIRLDLIAAVVADESGHAVIVGEHGERFELGRAAKAEDVLVAAARMTADPRTHVDLATFLRHCTPYPLDPAYWLNLDPKEAAKLGARALQEPRVQALLANLIMPKPDGKKGKSPWSDVTDATNGAKPNSAGSATAGPNPTGRAESHSDEPAAAKTPSDVDDSLADLAARARTLAESPAAQAMAKEMFSRVFSGPRR